AMADSPDAARKQNRAAFLRSCSAAGSSQGKGKLWGIPGVAASVLDRHATMELRTDGNPERAVAASLRGTPATKHVVVQLRVTRKTAETALQGCSPGGCDATPTVMLQSTHHSLRRGGEQYDRGVISGLDRNLHLLLALAALVEPADLHRVAIKLAVLEDRRDEV